MASSELQEIGKWPARLKKVWRHPHPQLTHARLQTTKGTSPLNGRRRPSLKKNNHSQKNPVGIVADQNTQGLTALQKRKSAKLASPTMEDIEARGSCSKRNTDSEIEKEDK